MHVSTPVALYLLNHKRERLREIELRYVMRVIIAADDAQIAPQFRIEKVRTRSPDEVPPWWRWNSRHSRHRLTDVEDEEEEEAEAEAVGSEDDDEDEDTPEQQAADAAGDSGDEAERRRKRRRRRRRGGRRDEQLPAAAAAGVDEPPGEVVESIATADVETLPVAAVEDTELSEAVGEERSESGEASPAGDDDPRNRRRGRRGGRRRRRENEGEMSPFAVPGADQPELPPVYAGPTPADPFGGRAFDIFDVMDQAERAAESRPAQKANSAAEIINDTAPEPETSPREPVYEAAREASPVPKVMVETSEAEESVTAHAAEEVRGLEAAMAQTDATMAPPETALPPSVPAGVGRGTGGPAQAELEIVNSAAPEPRGEAVPDRPEAGPVMHPTPANDTSAEIAIPEPPPPEPLIKPILIGADGEQPAEKKRGWWRR